MEQTQTQEQEQEQVPIPIKTQEQLVEQYLQEMNNLEKQAYDIARSHLGTSFNILKSNGFIQWILK
jgi:hypothetical protein